jgi:hypothetical protein
MKTISIDDNIELVATMIIDCGTASEYAQLAYLIKRAGDYHNDKDLQYFYMVLKTKVISKAGIFDDLDQYIDAAIARLGLGSLSNFPIL